MIQQKKEKQTMNEYRMHLQMFAAGDVVNYAGDTNTANAGTYDTNLNTPVSSGTTELMIDASITPTSMLYT